MRRPRASGIGDPDIPTPSNVVGSVQEVFQGEWPDKVANQTPKHCWTAIGAAPWEDTPLGPTPGGRRDSEDAWS